MKTDTRVADGTTRSIPPIISTLSAPTFSFLYSEQFSEDFHLAALHDMCRVAKEVRVFPLLALDGERSSYVDAARG